MEKNDAVIQQKLEKKMNKNKTEKKSISSRINKSTYDKLVSVSNKVSHRFYDRKVAYMVNKILLDWTKKKEANI